MQKSHPKKVRESVSLYVTDFKNKSRRRQNKTYQRIQNTTTFFPKIRSHHGRPCYFRCSYFWSLSKPQKKSPEIIAPKNSIIILAYTSSIIKEKTKKEPCGTGGKRVSHVISWRVHQEPRISCFRRLSATTSTKKKPHVRPTRPEIGYCIGRRGRARRHSIPFSAIRGTYNSRYFLEN